MFRALVWKEWRQLRLVRWGGVLLGAILPLALVAGAELSSRGLLPTGRTSGYRPRDVMYEVLPATFALALWPLIALMSAAQAFGGDRAAGTESFLLERPVSRTRTWWARAAASIGTILVVVVSTAAIGTMVAYLSGPPPGIGWSRWAILAGAGVGTALLAWIGATFAASMLASPLAAVLLGAIAGAFPVVLAVEWMPAFEFARLGRIPIGSALCGLLPPALLIASWSASSRGEPAGRGRVKRALGVSGATLAAVPLAFAAITPAALRMNAARGFHTIDPNPAGNAAFVAAYTEERAELGWLVGVPGGRPVRFLPPGVWRVAWSRDGALAGILTSAGSLGSARSAQRIDLLDPRDGAVVRSLGIPEEEFCDDFVIVEGSVVAIVLRENDKRWTSDLRIARPGSTSWTATGLRWPRSLVRLVGPLADGRLFLERIEWREDSEAPKRFRPHRRLYPIDLGRGTVGPELSVETPSSAAWLDRRYGGMSPSGGYAIVDAEGDAREHAILDLKSGATIPGLRIKSLPVWLEGDRLAWIENGNRRSTLLVASPSRPPATVRSWIDADVGLKPSPGGGALFVSVAPQDEAELKRRGSTESRSAPGLPRSIGKVPEELVYLPGADRLVDLAPPFSDRPRDRRYSEWAGPKTLARIADGVVYFEDIDRPGERRFVIGSASDLR